MYMFSLWTFVALSKQFEDITFSSGKRYPIKCWINQIILKIICSSSTTFLSLTLWDLYVVTYIKRQQIHLFKRLQSSLTMIYRPFTLIMFPLTNCRHHMMSSIFSMTQSIHSCCNRKEEWFVQYRSLLSFHSLSAKVTVWGAGGGAPPAPSPTSSICILW